MKKLFLTLAILMAVSFSAYADGNESNDVNAIEAYDLKININSLVRYLNLANWQAVSVENVHDVFTEALRGAAYIDGDSRKRLVRNAVNYNLKNIKGVLNEEQYKKYLAVFNVTLVNRGIEL